ncbi:MAG: discoidin domain-containing protein [Brevinematales bacterium]
MFNNLYFFLFVFLLFLSCSNYDDMKVAGFSYKGKEYFVKIKDVKDDFLLTARRYRQITNDINYHKISIFANYLSKDVALIEELESGLTNSVEFKSKYELLKQKKYYSELFSRGEKILLKEMRLNLKNKYKGINQEEKQVIEKEYADNFKKENIKSFYEIDNKKNLIKINQEFYNPFNIPEDIILFKVFDKPYNWKISKWIILMYNPNFNEKKIEDFIENMENLKDLLIVVEVAKKKGIERGIKIKEENIIKEIALESFRNKIKEEFKVKVLPEITTDIIKAYYESNKNLAFVEKDGKKLQLTYNDVKDEISNVICEEKWRDFLRKWNEEMRKKYNVIYNEQGINTLMKMETEYISKIFRRRENLALNKASFNSMNINSKNAFDGDENTLFVFDSPDSKWIGVDLGKKYPIKSVVIKWDVYPESFIVQISSDGKQWRNVYYVDKVFSGINEVLLENIRTRYLRIFTYSAKSFSIKEFEVY